MTEFEKRVTVLEERVREFESQMTALMRELINLTKCILALICIFAIWYFKESYEIRTQMKNAEDSIAEEVCVIELNIYQQDDGELTLIPANYGEIWPFEFDANENMIPKSQKNVLHVSSPIDLDEKMRFRFALPMGPWYENSEFVAISPSGAEQIIKDVPGTPNLDINAFYEFYLEERGAYTIELRNLDDETEQTTFTLVW